MFVNPIANILYRTQPHNKMNIWTFCSPEFDAQLSKIDQNFFTITERDLEHFTLLNKTDIPINLFFDCILCEGRENFFDAAFKLGHTLHVPRLIYHPNANNVNRSLLGKTGDLDIYNGEEVRKKWGGIGYVIEDKAEDFINQWNEVFENVKGIIYVR